MSEARNKRESASWDARLFLRLWEFVRPHQHLLWIGLGLLLLTSGARLLSTYLVKIAIDDHLIPGVQQGLMGLLMAFAGVNLVELLARRSQMLTIDRAGHNALRDLRCKLFRHLQKQSARFYDKHRTGTLVGRITTDVEALYELFSSGVVTILGDVFFLTATIAILLSLDWRLTLVTMTVVPVLLLATTIIRRYVRSAYETMRSRTGQMNGFLHENVGGMSLIQIFRREHKARGEFTEINTGVRDAQLSTVVWESTLSATTEMLGSFTTALILWYGGGLVVESMGGPRPADLGSWSGGLTLGILYSFVDYMQKFFTPLSDLSQKYTVLQNAMTAGSRIFGLFDTDESIKEAEHPVEAPPARGLIEFRDVHFAYDPSEPVLRGLSFRLEAGERVAVVGATGAGKTTLMKLLTRLYDVDAAADGTRAGGVFLDGVDVRDWRLNALRQRVGVVQQEPFLFEGTVLDNIRLGQSHVDPKLARAAATRLGLDECLERLPRGYDEPILERGKNLSAGEKQLVAFARILASEPEVLVLDEATANVDSHTEALLQSAEKEVLRGRTSLIIAHRLSTVIDADRILVMQKGEIVEQGNHESLMQQRGLYWRLCKLQLGSAGAGDAEQAEAGASLNT